MSENQAQPPVQPPPPATPPPSAPNPESQARMWNMLCHLSALAGVLVPFGNIIGPLVIWQIKKNEFPSVDIHGKMALNFQITALVVLFGGTAIAFVGSFICLGWLLFPLLMLLGLGALICTVIAGVKANNGEDYKYPFSIEFVK